MQKNILGIFFGGIVQLFALSQVFTLVLVDISISFDNIYYFQVIFSFDFEIMYFFYHKLHIDYLFTGYVQNSLKNRQKIFETITDVARSNDALNPQPSTSKKGLETVCVQPITYTITLLK